MLASTCSPINSKAEVSKTVGSKYIVGVPDMRSKGATKDEILQANLKQQECQNKFKNCNLHGVPGRIISRESSSSHLFSACLIRIEFGPTKIACRGEEASDWLPRAVFACH